MHTSLFPTTLPESPRRNMHNLMPSLPAIRTTTKAYSPGPLGATPREMPRSLQSLAAAQTSAYPQSESPPFMNPIAASHAMARNRHAKKAEEKGGVGAWYHRKMAQRENTKFKKMYV